MKGLDLLSFIKVLSNIDNLQNETLAEGCSYSNIDIKFQTPDGKTYKFKSLNFIESYSYHTLERQDFKPSIDSKVIFILE